MKNHLSKSIARAPGKTQISISLPQDLVDRIDALAAADCRNRSNYIATRLEELASSTITGNGDGHPLPPFDSTKTRTVPARRR